MARLPKNRTRIVEQFKAIFSKEPQQVESVALFVAFQVEDNIQRLHAIETRSNEYNAKVRTLFSNLKKNEELRGRVYRGELPPPALVQLDAKELATEDVKRARELTASEASEAKQSDFWLHNKAKIDEMNGVKQTGSMYRCRNPACGSDKTDNYQVQTRSSDEPMTVFVTCLVCTSRYRC